MDRESCPRLAAARPQGLVGALARVVDVSGSGEADALGVAPATGAEFSLLATEALSLRRGPYRLPYRRHLAACALARVAWGVDLSAMYWCARRVGRLQGVRVAEVPARAAVGARVLAPGAGVRYVAGDRDERVLRRVRRRAAGRRLSMVQTVAADLSRLPFADGEVDVFLCFDGIQWVADRAGALREIARCLAPGGRLIGTSFFSDLGRRGELLASLASRRGCVSPPDREQLYLWMHQAGLVDATLSAEHGFAQFNASKPPATSAARPRRSSARRSRR